VRREVHLVLGTVALCGVVLGLWYEFYEYSPHRAGVRNAVRRITREWLREAPDPNVGESFTIACGFRADVPPFSGRLVYEGGQDHLRPISDATISLAEASPFFKRPVILDGSESGDFVSNLALWSSRRTAKKDGVTVSSSVWTEEQLVVIEAPGCEPKSLRYTESWVWSVIVLQCPDRNSHGKSA
jgi:hypothetical protein